MNPGSMYALQYDFPFFVDIDVPYTYDRVLGRAKDVVLVLGELTSMSPGTRRHRYLFLIRGRLCIDQLDFCNSWRVDGDK